MHQFIQMRVRFVMKIAFQACNCYLSIEDVGIWGKILINDKNIVVQYRESTFCHPL